jgi:hypothetical protein
MHAPPEGQKETPQERVKHASGGQAHRALHGNEPKKDQGATLVKLWPWGWPDLIWRRYVAPKGGSK